MTDKAPVKYYLVQLCTGDWDGTNWQDLFITGNERLAKRYCRKGNVILKRYKRYYLSLLTKVCSSYKKIHPRHDDYVHISNRKELTNGLFAYREIDFRTH